MSDTPEKPDTGKTTQTASARKAFKLKEPLIQRGKTLAAGDSVSLTPQQASRLLASGHI